MKKTHIWAFCISLLWAVTLFSQEIESELLDESPLDTIVSAPKTPLTLRVGVDLYRPIRSRFDDTFQGIEWAGDLLFRKNTFIAMELGSVEVTKQTEQVNSTTSGSYQKLGLELNLYENWEGMNNHVTLGFRIARSSYSQTLNSYTILDRTPFWVGYDEPVENGFSTGLRENLNALWVEAVLGFKVQLFKNIYLGLGLRLHRLVNNTQPENFDNIYIPGFNRKTDENKFGASVNYTLSYSLPFRFSK
ncbi:MAG: DUF6048 family protein [Flavobacteriaceae bacterium]